MNRCTMAEGEEEVEVEVEVVSERGSVSMTVRTEDSSDGTTSISVSCFPYV
jgi:hypothetical protein